MTSSNINLWDSFNLKSSPYFQTALEKGSETKSLNLFVGRQKEQRRLLTAIGSSDSSRQAVAGPPGIGKTTLVEVVKNEASEVGYWVADDIISVTTESSGMLLGQLLAGVYNAVDLASHGANVKDDPAVKEAHQLVCAVRLRNTSMNVMVAGVGGGGGRSEMISNPPSALILDGPRVLRNLLDYAKKNEARGVLLHLNNLENLSKIDVKEAANRLRDIRDQALMLDGLHLIIVGATSAISSTVNLHPQIRSVFRPTVTLEKLNLSDVHKLLEKRYEALRNELNKPYQKPIDDRVVEKLYALFDGDLRGMLKSLEDGIETLLLDVTDVRDLSFTLNDLFPVLKKQNQEELEEALDPKTWNHILTWAKGDPDLPQTQDSLSKIWGIKGQVSTIINHELIPNGAVESLPEKHSRKIQYRLTSKARLATLQD